MTSVLFAYGDVINRLDSVSTYTRAEIQRKERNSQKHNQSPCCHASFLPTSDGNVISKQELPRENNRFFFLWEKFIFLSYTKYFHCSCHATWLSYKTSMGQKRSFKSIFCFSHFVCGRLNAMHSVSITPENFAEFPPELIVKNPIYNGIN